jgi:cephalosporin-C deacetylase-like acetyl esterase
MSVVVAKDYHFFPFSPSLHPHIINPRSIKIYKAYRCRIFQEAFMSMIGKRLAHYEIIGQLGKGGMGEVFLAHDTSLDRKVAIKFLPESIELDQTAHKRLMREAKSAAALDHPYICSIHEVGEAEGRSYIVMEHIEGQTLKDKLAQGEVPLKNAMQWSIEIAEALAVAHEKGIIHRDLKPSNIMISRTGYAKVMDFGLAKQLYALTESGSQEETLTGLTREGTTVGTIPYMSPEQIRGKAVDLRSDLFSFGVVIYEMLSGINPFKKETSYDTADAIRRDIPPSLSEYRKDVPQQLEKLVGKLLAKDPADRIQKAREVADNLQKAFDEAFGKQIIVTRSVFSAVRGALKKPVYLIPLILMLAAAAYFLAQGVRTYQKGKWAQEVAPRETKRLIDQGRTIAAARLLKEAMRYAPNSRELDQLNIGIYKETVSVQTIPHGADIYVRDYADTENNDPSSWELLGRSPLDVSLPTGDHRFRIVKEGFEPVELAAAGSLIRLHRPEEIPSGMVWVSSYPPEGISPDAAPPEAREFWIDKYEVTNRQFKEFFDAGGYQKREYWKEPFIKDGKQLSWDEAMALFCDPVGRPGPATWEFGTYPEGKEDFPVGGISWYEAAAYAEFAGKSLPTVYHWYHASGINTEFGDIVRFSNFSTKGLERVGYYRGLGRFGTYDMAGNIKEWCWNQTGDRRYVMGGAWNEPTYQAGQADARPPFDRSENLGFRCVKYNAPPLKALMESIPSIGAMCVDRTEDTPADDQAFKIYLDLHSYNKTDLKATVESVDDTASQYWRKEKISFQAAYGNERMSADLFLPKKVDQPYQTIIFFPGSGELTSKVLDPYGVRIVEHILRTGRAVMVPAYKGMFERGPAPAGYIDRELTLHWSKDLGRSIDYLETRSDIDLEKLTYFGYSMGGWAGPRLIAVEPRIKAGVLAATCSGNPVSPEVDPWNFASRVKIPILVISGRYDFICRLEPTVIPLYNLLGTPEEDKLLKIYERGHALFDGLEVFKDMFLWLDRYLGRPVEKPVR